MHLRRKSAGKPICVPRLPRVASHLLFAERRTHETRPLMPDQSPASQTSSLASSGFRVVAGSETPRTDAEKCRMGICMTSVEVDGVPAAFARTLERETYALRSLLARCLPIVERDAQMMADIRRHAPLDPTTQAKHDSTEYESEKLVREIPAALGFQNDKARHEPANGEPKP